MRCLASDCLQSLKRTSVLKRPMTHSASALSTAPLSHMLRMCCRAAGRVCAACPRGIGIANGSNREIDLGCSQPLGILYRQVLRSAVRVMNQILVIRRLSLPDSLIQRIHCPAGFCEANAERGERTGSSWMSRCASCYPEGICVQTPRGQSLFGRSALNKRFTLSSIAPSHTYCVCAAGQRDRRFAKQICREGGHGCDVSGWVVMTFLPRTTPLIPKLRIKRSTAVRQCMFTCTRGGAAGDIFTLPPQNVPNLPRAIELAVGIPSCVDLDAQNSI
jgi:hypothetical protein